MKQISLNKNTSSELTIHYGKLDLLDFIQIKKKNNLAGTKLNVWLFELKNGWCSH